MSGDAHTASERVRAVLEALVDWFTGLSAADWLAIGIAAAALFWIWASLRAMTRLGPVVVEPLEGEAETTLPVKELTAILRERLARGGLSPPPAVPGGAPQANVLSAIEASNVPQIALVAQVMGTLPRPRPAEYKIGGTLIGGPPSASSSPPVAGLRAPDPENGLRFWLQPSREGRELLDTITRAKHADAVRCAADLASLHIIDSSAHALPLWVRWSKVAAFADYIDGVEQSLKREDLKALTKFVEAASAEPTNLLVRLKIANLQERRAGSVADDVARAVARADALQMYLQLAKLQKGLVEARYRASVLAGMLASALDTLPTAKEEVCDQLPILGVTERVVVDRLRELAADESKAVLQLLRPWYALLRETRLRHQLELKGFDRRQLRRTVAISRHCLRVRRVGLATGRWVTFELWVRRMIIRYRYLAFGGSWQAHYNAASFYALLYHRARALQEDPS